MPQGPQPSSSILVFTVPDINEISPQTYPGFAQVMERTTWVKRCDDDSGKVERPVGGEHSTAELGVRVGGVGGEGGLRFLITCFYFCASILFFSVLCFF